MGFPDSTYGAEQVGDLRHDGSGCFQPIRKYPGASGGPNDAVTAYRKRAAIAPVMAGAVEGT